MIELKVYDAQKKILIKDFSFGNKDKVWAIEEKEYSENKGFVCRIYFRRKKKYVSISSVFELLSDIIDEGNEHASQIMPELRLRIKSRVEKRWGDVLVKTKEL